MITILKKLLKIIASPVSLAFVVTVSIVFGAAYFFGGSNQGFYLPTSDVTGSAQEIEKKLKNDFLATEAEIKQIAAERYLVCDRKETKTVKEAIIWSTPEQFGHKITKIDKGEAVTILLKDTHYAAFKIKAGSVAGWVDASAIENPYCYSFHQSL